MTNAMLRRAATEQLRLATETGVTLNARFRNGENGATIVLSHGYLGHQDELRHVESALHSAGFSVLTYDLRGCGKSSGAVTFGAYEHRDLCSLIDYLALRPDVDERRIGAYGFSMGGATTLLAAARDSRIGAVVADSAWADVRHWLRPRLRTLLRHPTDSFTPLALGLAQRRHHFKLSELRPAEAIGEIDPRPILLIHGEDDDVVPPGDASLNQRGGGPNIELWILPDVRHGDTIAAGGDAYTTRVIDFFERALFTNAVTR